MDINFVWDDFVSRLHYKIKRQLGHKVTKNIGKWVFNVGILFNNRRIIFREKLIKELKNTSPKNMYLKVFLPLMLP